MQKYLITGAGAPYVNGAAHYIGWNQIETAEGRYDWSTLDGWKNPWSSAGKLNGLLVCPVSYGGRNSFTPSWYSGPMMDSNSGSTCGDGRIPVYWDTQFISAWKSVLQAVVNRYGSDSSVAYIRPGFGVGFENYAAANAGTGNGACPDLLKGYGYSTSAWMGYLEEMVSFAASLSAKFQFSLNYPSYGNPDPSDVQTLAGYAVGYGMGLANAGLQSSDLKSDTGTNDWIEAFAQHSGEVALGQQTFGASDPDGTAPPGSNSQKTGSLVPLLPFAQSKGTQVFELYTSDLLGTFDPQSSNYSACQKAGYPAAIKAAASSLG